MEPLVGSSVAFSLSPEKNLWQTWSSGYTRVIKHLPHIISADIKPFVGEYKRQEISYDLKTNYSLLNIITNKI